MDFSPPPRRPPNVTLLPMINVVFLLLVFFLLAAKIAPPEPFATDPPEARAAEEAAGEFTLFLGPDGRLGFQEVTGDAATVLPALASARAAFCAGADCTAAPPRLSLRADRAAPAEGLAALLPQLGALGFARVDLIATGS